MTLRIPAFALGATALGLAACAAALSDTASATPSGPSHPAVQCNIERVTTAHGTTLHPVVRSTATLSGSYQIAVETSGRGGSSSVSQGGDFLVSPGRPQTLGSVSLGPSPGSSIVARMDVIWPHGRTHCSLTERL